MLLPLLGGVPVLHPYDRSSKTLFTVSMPFLAAFFNHSRISSPYSSDKLLAPSLFIFDHAKYILDQNIC